MFTGIIQEVGTIKNIEKKASFWRLGILSTKVYKDINLSQSVCVNGVCLTLTKKENNVLFFEVIKPTLENTNLKRLRPLCKVNLELPLKPDDRLGGHFVLGHIDCETQIKSIIKKNGFYSFEIKTPLQFKKFLIEKGCIAIEGISLTVQKVLSKSFIVNIIPFTFNHTNLNTKRPGSWVNLEFDYLLKAVLKNT